MLDKIVFTLIENERGPAAKMFSLKPDGSLDKRSAAQIFEGTARRVEFASLEEFIKFRGDLPPNQALTYGVTKAASARLVTQTALSKSPGAISRDAEHFEFAEKRPGVFMLDYDPRPGAKPLSAEELDRIICEVTPELAGVNRAWVSSSSAFIYDTDGLELIGQGGLRLYIVVDDASRIPAIGAMLYQRLWAAGYGYMTVSKAGSILDRSIIDASVWQAERLDFAAAPVLHDGLERRAPAPLIIPGAPKLATAGLAPAQPMSEWRQTSAQLKEAREQKKPEAEQKRKAFIKARIDEMKRRGISAKRTQRVYQDAIENRVLRADIPLLTEEGKTVTVKEVLDNPALYHNTRFHDPLEPEYRNDPRIAYVSLGQDPYMWTHAHGGGRYRLCSQTDTVKVTKGELHRAVDETIEIMGQRKDLYVRGNELVRVVDENIIQMDEASLANYLGHAVKYTKPYAVEGGIEWRPFDPPAALVKQVLAKRTEMRLQQLERVTTAPTLRPDGSVLSEPGYDAGTGLLLVGQGFPPIPLNPTEHQLDQAFRALWHPFKDFPFDTRFDRGVMLAAVLTALARHLFRIAPAYNFDAPAAGTGKTLLASCIQAICGMQPSAIPQCRDEEEMRKRLLSCLREGKPSILLDNIRGEFTSATLEALITSETFKDRKLGCNETLSLPTAVTILISGNNLRLGGDLFRRVLSCRIDAKTELPERRSFDLHPVEYCIKHRQALVAAGLTLLRGFISAGRPRDPYAGGKLGSFEAWDDLIRQAVLWIGREGIADVGDPIMCVQRAKSEEPERQTLAAFVAAVQERWGSDPWQVKDLIFAAEAGTDLHDAMTDIAGDRHAHKSIDARKLGKWLSAHRGARSGGLYLDQREYLGKTKAAVRWLVRSERDGAGEVHAERGNNYCERVH